MQQEQRTMKYLDTNQHFMCELSAVELNFWTIRIKEIDNMTFPIT